MPGRRRLHRHHAERFQHVTIKYRGTLAIRIGDVSGYG